MQIRFFFSPWSAVFSPHIVSLYFIHTMFPTNGLVCHVILITWFMRRPNVIPTTSTITMRIKKREKNRNQTQWPANIPTRKSATKSLCENAIEMVIWSSCMCVCVYVWAFYRFTSRIYSAMSTDKSNRVILRQTKEMAAYTLNLL